MEFRFLVVEVEGIFVNDLKVVGRYRNLKDAQFSKDIFKAETPSSSYVVSVILKE